MFNRVSPVGIFFLVSAKIMEMESFEAIVGQLGMYFTTVLLGLFIHGFIVIPIYYSVCTRKLPFRFIINMSQALLTAFGTGSRYNKIKELLEYQYIVLQVQKYNIY